VIGVAGLERLSPLDKQFLAIVSREVLKPQSDPSTIDLERISADAARMLRLEGGEGRRLRQRLLGAWTDPRSSAEAFAARLQVELGCEGLAVAERDLLARLAGIERSIADCPSGRPKDQAAQLPACLTSEGWNGVFAIMADQYAGIAGDAAETREYLNPGGRRMVERLADIADVRAGQRVLNLCSGEGGEARHLARLGARVTAVDISDVGCAVAQRLNEAQHLDDKIAVVCDDIARLDPKDKGYDLIFFPDADGVHYQQDRIELFRRLRSKLKDDGKLVGSFYIPGEGAPDAIKKQFDDSMAWAGFRPEGVNADNYKAELEAAGFDVEIRRFVGDEDIAAVYRDWQTRAQANMDAHPEIVPDPSVKKWLELAPRCPNGCGFVIVARPRGESVP
jgi:cyclopropane fatty-acyl-phospholipid synthase-like methyltransferase